MKKQKHTFVALLTSKELSYEYRFIIRKCRIRFFIIQTFRCILQNGLRTFLKDSYQPLQFVTPSQATVHVPIYFLLSLLIY